MLQLLIQEASRSMANAIGISKGDLLALGQPLGFGLSFMRIEHLRGKI
jgi:hypothetical protein